MLTDQSRPTKLWASDGTLHHFSQTMAAILTAPYLAELFDEEEFDLSGRKTTGTLEKPSD